MSAAVICSSCGSRLEVPPDYQRRKLQCAECGVMCELPPPSPLTAPDAFPEAPAALESPPRIEEREPEPAPRPALPAAAPPAVREQAKRPPTKGKTLVLTCSFCGERVRLAVGKRGQPGTCPNCGSAVKPPPPPPPKAKPAPPIPPVVRETDPGVLFTPDDDGNPYPMIGGKDIICPDCHRRLPAGTDVCTGCGLDLKTGAKPPPPTYEPVERRWEVGWSYKKRLRAFLLAHAFVLSLFALAVLLHGSLFGVIAPWLIFTALFAFVIGTHDRIELARNARGQVRLTKTWRAFFIERPTEVIHLREYEGVATGADSETGCWEWFIFFILLWFAVIPGLIWWYFAIHKDTYFVALTKDHGYPEKMIYRGGSSEDMHDIAGTLRDVGGLPYDGG